MTPELMKACQPHGAYPSPFPLATCPRKLFAEGMWLTYIDIVTDTHWGASPDLITWNTMVLKLKLAKLERQNPQEWKMTASVSMQGWKVGNKQPLFSQTSPGSRRGYATFVVEEELGAVSRDVSNLPTNRLDFRSQTSTADLPTGYKREYTTAVQLTTLGSDLMARFGTCVKGQLKLWQSHLTKPDLLASGIAC